MKIKDLFKILALSIIIVIMLNIDTCSAKRAREKTNRQAKDYSKLIDAFPQLQNSSTPMCIKEMQKMFMELSQPDK